MPVSASQILIVISLDADATRHEFGEKAAELTQSVCPSSVCKHALQLLSIAGLVVTHSGSSCWNSSLTKL